MSVWFAIPSARPPEQVSEILDLWRGQGYKIALWLDLPPEGGNVWNGSESWRQADFSIVAPHYPGYAVAINTLIAELLKEDPGAEWIVIGGDDVEPDLAHTAEQIARECCEYFEEPAGPYNWEHSTFGVMQPTGDRWGENDGSGLPGAYIDRVCGSPWLGREFCQRMYRGAGPLYPGYLHMFVDEELQAVASKLGVLWQRRDLIHYHRHWARKAGASAKDCPEFLRAANSPEHWEEAGALFRQRQAAGFPGHEPL